MPPVEELGNVGWLAAREREKAAEAAAQASTSEDLYAFQSRKDPSQPGAPRLGKDVDLDENGNVVPQTFDPENGMFGKGVSLTNNPNATSLSGNYFRLPAGTNLPRGINIVRDGRDLYPDSERGEGHASAYPSTSLSLNNFTDLYRSLFDSIPAGCKR